MSYKILVIDDEPVNRDLIETYLEEREDYELINAVDGVEGWDILKSQADEIDLILLDRMMPNMNGMEFIQKVNEEGLELKRIPIIMQTAAAEKEQIAEGIAAGVYYYLTKPYSEEVLLSVVAGALQDSENKREVTEQIKTHKKCFGLTSYSQWDLSTLRECRDMAVFIACYFPDPERVSLGILELLVNAVEHGNLGVSYEMKSKLIAKGNWEEEIKRRCALPQNKDKKVSVKYSKTDDVVELVIKDEGEGFDWSQYLELSPDRATDSHGRGIAMSKMLSFDEMEYLGCGNEVVCRVALN